jgi:hypothetical protein
MQYAIASVGPERFTFREGHSIPAGATGQLEVRVDDEVYQWDVELRNGAVPFDHTVEYHQVKKQRSLFV